MKHRLSDRRYVTLQSVTISSGFDRSCGFDKKKDVDIDVKQRLVTNSDVDVTAKDVDPITLTSRRQDWHLV